MNQDSTDNVDATEEKVQNADSPAEDIPKLPPPLSTLITSQKFRNLAELLDNVHDVDALLAYLDKELRDFQENPAIKAAFQKHSIDGYAFQNIRDIHLKEMKMNPPLTLGQRLHLLTKTKKVQRAVRYKTRREVIMKGKCFVDPPRLHAEYEMTQAYLKFTYEKKYQTETKESDLAGCLCFATRTYTSDESMAKYVDHVDISLVDDVDIKENEQEHELTQPSLCCIKSSPVRTTVKNNVIFVSLNIQNESGMHIAGKDDAESSVLAVRISDLQEAEKFRNTLQDLMNEDQFANRRGTLGRRGSTHFL